MRNARAVLLAAGGDRRVNRFGGPLVARGGRRFPLRERDGGERGVVHALEREQFAMRIHNGNRQRPVVLHCLRLCGRENRLGGFESQNFPVGELPACRARRGGEKYEGQREKRLFHLASLTGVRI